MAKPIGSTRVGVAASQVTMTPSRLQPLSTATAAIRPGSIPGALALASAPVAARTAVLSAAGLGPVAAASPATLPGIRPHRSVPTSPISPATRPSIRPRRSVSASPSTPASVGLPIAGRAVSIHTDRDHLSFHSPDFSDFEPTLSYDKAFDSIRESTRKVHTDLKRDHDQLRQLAQSWNRVSIVFAAIGFTLILLAVTVLILGETIPGLVTVGASVVTKSVAALFFVQARRADHRLDILTERRAESAEMFGLVAIVETIEEPDERTKLKIEIVRRVLTMSENRAR